MKKILEIRKKNISFFQRGFTYKGFQCQRCDCVVHKDCYDRCVHPCTGIKYPDVGFVRISSKFSLLI